MRRGIDDFFAVRLMADFNVIRNAAPKNSWLMKKCSKAVCFSDRSIEQKAGTVDYLCSVYQRPESRDELSRRQLFAIIFRWHIPPSPDEQMYLKAFRHTHTHTQHSDISKMTLFGQFFGPLSDLYRRAHKRNYTVFCITLEKEMFSFNKEEIS
jgi:hypothetical protein